MSNFPTRKSFKSLLRDKPRHSGKLLSHGLSPRKGGAGRGNVGRPGDELNQPHLHPNDPNYAPDEDEEDEALYSLPTSSHLLPSSSSSSSFSSSIASYSRFKAAIKAAAKEYVASLDLLEFSAAVQEQRLPLFHQDLPSIVIKLSFDLSPTARHALASLLLHLYKQTPQLITAQHISHSVTKLCYALPDLLLDVPQARCYIREFALFFVAAGMLEGRVWEECEAYEGIMMADTERLKTLKQRIDVIVTELLATEEVDDAVQSIQGLQCPTLHCEVVKALLRSSFDRGNRQRELASRFLCFATGSLFSSEAVEQGFAALLQRVEDVHIDVPDVLHLLSVFMARAVVDDTLQPSFLSRVDLDERDLGAQVLQQAGRLLQGEGRAERMESCWRGEREARRGSSQLLQQQAKGAVEERKEFAADAVQAAGDDVKR